MTLTLTLLSLHEAALLPDGCLGDSFPRRTERAAHFIRVEDRLRCIGAGALLRGLTGITERQLCYGERGKPFAPDADHCFSLSHGGGYILLALDSTPVGADIEPLDEQQLTLAETVFCSDELEWQQFDRLPRFYTLWTLKESVMKQCGAGLSLPPDSFSVLPLVRGEHLRLNGQILSASTCFFDGHCISVCAAHPLPPLEPRLVTAAELLYR